MAMYLFASRLSSAVCTRRPHDVTTTATRLEVGVQCASCSRLSNVKSPTSIPVSSSLAGPPTTTTTTVVEVERSATPPPLERNSTARATVGPCDRSHRPCDSRVPSTTKHRVRFANTFPRVNRKKRLSDSHEEGEIIVQKEDYDESPTNSRRNQELVFRDSNLVSGTLEALIQRVVPTPNYYPDRAFLFAFLLTSRMFIRPNQLLGQVVFLANAGQPSYSQEHTPRIIPRLVQLLAEWMETFPYDFRDERIMGHVRSIISKCGDGAATEGVSSILQGLLDRLTALQRYEEFLQRVALEDSDGGSDKTEVTELCSKPEVLAQQLTVVELERLSYIGPEEFVEAFVREGSRENGSAGGRSTHSHSKNLQAYVAWSHRLTYLVASEIVRQPKKAKRVKLVDLWIATAQCCHNLGNYNSLMAILSGLNLSAVARLRKTWTKVDRQRFVVLEKKMEASGDFAAYRLTLRAASKRLASSPVQDTRIFIPFFSLFLKDVFVLQEACSKKLPNGHINFERFWQMAKLVTEFITWQQVSCPHVKQTATCLYLQSRRLCSETELARLSFICEAPTTVLEQEQWKTLKKEEDIKRD